MVGTSKRLIFLALPCMYLTWLTCFHCNSSHIGTEVNVFLANLGQILIGFWGYISGVATSGELTFYHLSVTGMFMKYMLIRLKNEWHSVLCYLANCTYVVHKEQTHLWQETAAAPLNSSISNCQHVLFVATLYITISDVRASFHQLFKVKHQLWHHRFGRLFKCIVISAAAAFQPIVW